MKSTVRLKVKVIPGASNSKVVGWLGDSLKVRVSAPPEKGKANAALLRLLARELHLQEAALTVVAGSTSQNKVVEIHGLAMSDILESFGGLRGQST